MNKFYFLNIISYFIIIFLYQISLIFNSCISGVNHCSICNPLTDLCYICDKENFAPDENGGCDYKKICLYGKNYCKECSKENENICEKCEDGYYPDEYGGCSYTKNCILSDKGKCLKCKDNYILAGMDNYFNEGIKICKSIFAEDLKFCKTINKYNGLCSQCKDGYYLSQKDSKCSSSENCDESIFGICSSCHSGYYLDKKNNECKKQIDNFSHCQESFDGEKCDICDNDYFFDENGKCIYNNYCLREGEYYKCEKCVENYFLTEKDYSCTREENCQYGDRITGICTSCKENYYIDFNDGKCKSNIEENDFKYCKVADVVCKECISIDYFIGEDHKCSSSRFCSESFNGTCFECIDNYYIGLDNKCTNVKHCIYSDYYNQCLECEGDYYFNKKDNVCKIGEGNLTNCKISEEGRLCSSCKDDFYLNQTDHLCYSNLEGGKFYKCGITDLYADYCIICRKDYYIDRENKCSKVDGCELSENEDRCLECDSDYYCLDAKTGKCEYNDEIEKEENKFYFRCNKTNKEGTSCEICIDEFKPNENGLCVDKKLCDEYKDEKCIKCKNEEGNYCLNNLFECVEVYYNRNCLECNNIYDFDICSKCFDGYEINDFGECIEIKNNE